MDFAAALLGAVFGAVAGGLLTCVLIRQVLQQDRRYRSRERVYLQLLPRLVDLQHTTGDLRGGSWPSAKWVPVALAVVRLCSSTGDRRDRDLAHALHDTWERTDKRIALALEQVKRDGAGRGTLPDEIHGDYDADLRERQAAVRALSEHLEARLSG